MPCRRSLLALPVAAKQCVCRAWHGRIPPPSGQAEYKALCASPIGQRSAAFVFHHLAEAKDLL